MVHDVDTSADFPHHSGQVLHNLVIPKAAPHPSSPKYDDVNLESTFRIFLVVFGGGAEGGGGSLKFFFCDGLTWDDVFDWHNFVILPLSRLP